MGQRASRILGMERFRRGREYTINPAGRGFERVDPGEAVFTLDNKNRRYDPYNAGSPLYGYIKPGRRARVMVKYRTTGVTYTLLTGQIADIQPMSGHERVRLVINDYIRYLRIRIPSPCRRRTPPRTAPLSRRFCRRPVIPARSMSGRPPHPCRYSAAANCRRWRQSGIGRRKLSARSSSGVTGAATYYPLSYNSQPTHTLTQTQMLKEIQVSPAVGECAQSGGGVCQPARADKRFPIWTTASPIASTTQVPSRRYFIPRRSGAIYRAGMGLCGQRPAGRQGYDHLCFVDQYRECHRHQRAAETAQQPDAHRLLFMDQNIRQCAHHAEII
jgi:hypothetical protein